MASTIPESFIVDWNAEAVIIAQQMESVLLKMTNRFDFVGSEHSIPRFDAVEAAEGRSRNQGFYEATPDIDRVNVTQRFFNVRSFIDDTDQVQSNVDIRANYTRTLLAAINRKIDDEIIRALNTNTNTEVVLTPANTFNADGAIDVYTDLVNRDVMDDNDFNLVLHPRAFAQLAKSTQASSNDFVQYRPYMDMNIPTIANMAIATSTRLPALNTPDGRRIFAWKTNNLVTGFTMPVTQRIEWNVERSTWQVAVCVQMGALVTDQKAVARAHVAGL
jgi:hypothetical protein